MKNMTWDDLNIGGESIDILSEDEILEVEGGIAPAVVVAVVAGGFGAGYTFGKDWANRNNRGDDRRRRRRRRR